MFVPVLFQQSTFLITFTASYCSSICFSIHEPELETVIFTASELSAGVSDVFRDKRTALTPSDWPHKKTP